MQVQLGRHRRAARIDDVVLDRDVIGATLDGPGLDQLHAALCRRFEADADFIFTVLEFTRAGHHGHGGLVGGERATDQAGLRHINALGAFVQQQKIAGLVGHVGVLEQLGMRERAAFAVKH